MNYVLGKPYKRESKAMKILLYVMIATLVGGIIFLVISIRQYPHIGSVVSAQAHCMYDGRLNPDGSCDNSDPACPETIKTPLKGGCPSEQPEIKTETEIKGGK